MRRSQQFCCKIVSLLLILKRIRFEPVVGAELRCMQTDQEEIPGSHQTQSFVKHLLLFCTHLFYLRIDQAIKLSRLNLSKQYPQCLTELTV